MKHRGRSRFYECCFYIQGKGAPEILSFVKAQRNKDSAPLERNSG
jgi:hypothetical protein